ncbi:MAG: hypothetical protein J6T10_22570 [Methanobrevibacter sp.]|nr:hypothetical protein [Methanobrevibacter sp.]
MKNNYDKNAIFVNKIMNKFVNDIDGNEWRSFVCCKIFGQLCECIDNIDCGQNDYDLKCATNKLLLDNEIYCIIDIVYNNCHEYHIIDCECDILCVDASYECLMCLYCNDLIEKFEKNKILC